MDDIIHIFPLNDLKPHITEGFCCECDFRAEFAGNCLLIVHQSFDGRELKEQMIEEIKDNFNKS